MVHGPITREPTGEIEFHDAAGHPWDVKGPPSPRPDRVFPFHAPMIAASIKNELGLTFPNSLTGVHEPRGVMLDSTYLTPADHQALWHELRATLTHDEISRIRELTLDPPPDRKA